MHSGWYLVGYERSFAQPLTPLSIAERRLMAVNDGERIRIVDAICPHRGAHLAIGGRLDDGVVVCPFHARRIGLGPCDDSGLAVREYESVGYGGMIFALIGDGPETALPALLAEIAAGHWFVPGGELTIDAPARLVIENAFDDAHFHPVHGVSNHPRFRARPAEHGEYAVEGTFELPPSPWQREATNGSISVPFVARAFSPHLVVSEMGGADPYWVLTGATPQADGTSTVRVSLAVPHADDGSQPDRDLCRYLLRQSEAGIRSDAEIWAHMDHAAPTRMDDRDASVLGFQAFCRSFQPSAPGD